MKAVLLAAGRSFRMKPIQDKNFLEFLGKPLIAHQLSALVNAGFKEILVVGGDHNLKPLKALIKRGDFKGAKISLREQENLDLGMAGAILSSERWIKGDPFFAVSANDVLDVGAYSDTLRQAQGDMGAVLAYKVSKYFPGGYLKITKNGLIKGIVEKPGEGKEPSKLVNIVVHYHPNAKLLIEELKKVKTTKDDRYECAIQSLLDKGIKYKAVPYVGFWQPIKYPWHVLALMNHFLENIGSRVEGKGLQIAKSAKIYGEVYLAEGVKVLDNAVIQGPAYIGKNSIIATNALVRQSQIGENCVIGFGSEIARSYVGNNVWTHTNYVGDSVIGNDVSFGAGTVTGNLRLDEKNIFVNIKGEKVDCGSNKFGLVTGDHVRVGVNTSFMPGVKIGNNSFVGAGIVVAQDVPDNSYVTGDWQLKVKQNKETISPRKQL